MGHYGMNRVSPKEIFKKLRHHSQDVEFIGYHIRPSGNFVFIDSGESTRKTVLEAGKTVMGLKFLIRTFSDLQKVDQAVQEKSFTKRGSVVLSTPTGDKRLIHVALSQNISKSVRPTGEIGRNVKVLAWPTAQDVLCLYDRPAKNGSVGQATTAVLAAVCRQDHPGIYGTGRALGVIHDILENRNMRYE